MEEKLGKIDHHLFSDSILSNCGFKREEVRVGPNFGVDVSVVDLPGEMAMVMTSDPLSLIPSLGLEESAWLSVHLMANDIATSGFSPMYGQFVLNLPATFSKQDFNTYWNYIHSFSKTIGVAITGGHTGFIEGQNSTIAGGGTFITVAPKSKVITSQNASTGDLILVTKQCALSSISILAMSFPETTKNKLGQEIHAKACELFYSTSSLKDALTAVQGDAMGNGVTAMHDVTEGGVLGAIYELAYASNKGVLVFNDQLPIGEIPSKVCGLFELDPRYCIGAGSMVITCKKEKAQAVIDRLKLEDIPCCVVGEIKEKEFGAKIIEEDKEKELVYYSEDPYWASFFKAYQEGWK